MTKEKNNRKVKNCKQHGSEQRKLVRGATAPTAKGAT